MTDEEKLRAAGLWACALAWTLATVHFALWILFVWLATTERRVCDESRKFGCAAHWLERSFVPLGLTGVFAVLGIVAWRAVQKMNA